MKKITFFIIVLVSQVFYAQKKVYVTKTCGTVLFGKDNPVLLKRGDELSERSVFNLMEFSCVQAIDEKGNLYEITKQGWSNFIDLINKTHKKKNSSLTKKYFKFVWEKISGAKDSSSKIAVVFRGNVELLSPQDEMIVTGHKMTFKWKTNKLSSVFYIRNKTTNAIFKLSTKNKEITLFTENTIFKEGNNFEYTVADEEFPDLTNLAFNKFKIINNVVYNKLLKKHKKLAEDLNNLGYSKNRIATELFNFSKK